MKKLLHTSLLLLGLLLGSSAKAQTSVDIQYAEAYATSACPTPVNANAYIYGLAGGYNDVTDFITIQVFWGDGTSTTVTSDLIDSSMVLDIFSESGLTHTYTLPGTYHPVYIATGPDGNADTLIGDDIYVYAYCTTVDGHVYHDNNSNCTADVGEVYLAGKMVKVKNSSGTIIADDYTDASGYYNISIPGGLSGLTITVADWSGGMSLTCPVGPFGSSTSTSFDLGMECLSSTVDYQIGHTAYCGYGAPGSNGIMSFTAMQNSCSGTVSPATITLTLDPLVTYVSTITGPAPTTVSPGGNVLTWNVASLPAYTGWGTGFNVSIETYTSTSAVVMTPSCFDLEITGSGTDPHLSNNTEHTCLLIGGPYDPNNKEVLPAGIGAGGNVAPETEFTYTINFQNTGTAPAINVYVMDTISSNLDMETFNIIGTSHNMNPIFTGSNIVRFDYPGINLPDSNANEALSHGWVKYTIKAKPGLANGTQIKNTGHIYFDYNAAIVTNTTLNTIDIALGMNETVNPEMNNVLFPNPASTMATLQFGNNVSGTLLLVDATGKTVKQVQVNNSREVQLSLNEIPSGFYSLVVPGIQLKQNRLQVVK